MSSNETETSQQDLEKWSAFMKAALDPNLRVSSLEGDVSMQLAEPHRWTVFLSVAPASKLRALDAATAVGNMNLSEEALLKLERAAHNVVRTFVGIDHASPSATGCEFFTWLEEACQREHALIGTPLSGTRLGRFDESDARSVNFGQAMRVLSAAVNELPEEPLLVSHPDYARWRSLTGDPDRPTHSEALSWFFNTVRSVDNFSLQ